MPCSTLIIMTEYLQTNELIHACRRSGHVSLQLAEYRSFLRKKALWLRLLINRTPLGVNIKPLIFSWMARVGSHFLKNLTIAFFFLDVFRHLIECTSCFTVRRRELTWKRRIVRVLKRIASKVGSKAIWTHRHSGFNWDKVGQHKLVKFGLSKSGQIYRDPQSREGKASFSKQVPHLRHLPHSDDRSVPSVLAYQSSPAFSEIASLPSDNRILFENT